MVQLNKAAGLALVMATGLWLAGCDNGGSAVETRPRDTAIIEAKPEVVAEVAPEASAPAPVVTANRRETADAKIQRLFERNGADFGTATAEDYGDKVKAFTANPPKGTETVKRANGDTLYYQASTNTFAVTDSKGVPRTMFKPDNGPSYWDRQKETAPTFGQYRSR